MIVPSQCHSHGYMEELRRRELPVDVPTHQTSAFPQTHNGSLRDPLFQNISASSSVVTVAAQVPQAPVQQRHEPPWSQTSGYPAHDLHPLPSEVASPSVSSPTIDDSSSHRHIQSPKVKHHAVSRGRSPHKRSPTPSSSSLDIRFSPMPHKKKVAADMKTRPSLACFFCRGRKISCGPSPPGSTDQSCK